MSVRKVEICLGRDQEDGFYMKSGRKTLELGILVVVDIEARVWCVRNRGEIKEILEF